MRILYVLPFVPWPIKVRSFNLIPRLAEKHEIDLVCVARTEVEIARLEAIRGCCSSVRTGAFSLGGALLRSLLSLPSRTPLRIAYVSSRSMRKAVQAAIREKSPDVIYVERWRALQYIPSDCTIPVVCDPTDSMALYNFRLRNSGNVAGRALGAIEYLKFRNYEARLASQVSATVFCSRVDLEFLRQFAPEARLVQVPNGVDCNVFWPKQAHEARPDTLFFSGNFTYAPNRYAVTQFLRETFPAICRAVPGVTFTVAGNGAENFMREKHPGAAGVVVHDFVQDLRSHLASACVAVAPMTVGSGVSNKLLEAFATGTPIVSSSLACGDLPVVDGEHLLIADSREKFAASVIQLLQDAGLRHRMAASALGLVQSHYDWKIIAGAMDAVLLDAAKRGRSLRPEEAANSRNATLPTSTGPHEEIRFTAPFGK